MDTEKMAFLIRYIESCIPHEIDNVLMDSLTDPHYSAVYTTSLINLCIEFNRDHLKHNVPYSTIKEYFLFEGYTQEEYDVFESKRAVESIDYIGDQY